MGATRRTSRTRKQQAHQQNRNAPHSLMLEVAGVTLTVSGILDALAALPGVRG
jgi:hypothetical protein